MPHDQLVLARHVILFTALDQFHLWAYRNRSHGLHLLARRFAFSRAILIVRS